MYEALIQKSNHLKFSKFLMFFPLISFLIPLLCFGLRSELPNPYCSLEVTELCLISSPIFIKGDIFISTDLAIVIFYTSITCQIPCFINLISSLPITITGSNLYASSINLYSSSHISLTSSIVSTNGTISMGKGYTKLPLQGFGFAGMGSACVWWEELIDNSYGPNCATFADLDDLYSNETQGSGGIRLYEKGGGRIILKALGRITFKSSNITASGYPSADNTSLCEAIASLPYSKGGTGGFILIETEELIYDSQSLTRIEAQGGYYCGLLIIL